MAADIERLGKELLGKYPQIAEDLLGLAQKARIAGVPEELSQQNPLEILALEGLSIEWKNQAGNFVELGYHTELGLSVEDYLASLPKFNPQPEAFRGRFDIPVLVETRISPDCQAKLAGISLYLGDLEVCDWEKDPGDYITPDIAYTTWMQDGSKSLDVSVEFVRSALAEDERGATLNDGIALYIAKSGVLKDNYIDLPGTRVGAIRAPYLAIRHGNSVIEYARVDSPDVRFGSATCGRNTTA